MQIYPDIGNITNASLRYGINVKDDLEAGIGHIVALHLKETTSGVYRDMVAGEGHVNFPMVIKTAYEMGVRMYTAELWCNDNWEENIIRTYDFFCRILNEI